METKPMASTGSETWDEILAGIRLTQGLLEVFELAARAAAIGDDAEAQQLLRRARTEYSEARAAWERSKTGQ